MLVVEIRINQNEAHPKCPVDIVISRPLENGAER